MLRGAVLCIIGCVAASLSSAHYMSVAPSPAVTIKSLSGYYQISPRGRLNQFTTTALRVEPSVVVGQSEQLICSLVGIKGRKHFLNGGKHPTEIPTECIHSVGFGQDSLSESLQLPPRTSFSHSL